jgi:uncharacterized membrane protein
MTPDFYHVLHVFSFAALIGYAFYAYSHPTPETKKRVMMITGIAGLIQLIAGFGLVAKMGYSLSQGWIWVKIVCWVGLCSLPGMVYRRPQKAGTFIAISLVLVLISLVMVYYKPF